MHDSMFRSTDVLIDGQPAPHSFLAPGLLIVVRVGVAQEVPRRTHKGIHRIGFARGWTTAHRAGSIHKVPLIAQWRLACRLKLHIFGQLDRQLIFRHGHHAICWAVDDRNGRAPVTLPTNQPVAQAIGDGELADALLLQVARDYRDGLVRWRAIERPGIDHHAQVQFSFCPRCRVAWVLVNWSDHLAYGDAEFAGKLEVALVMRRNAHNRARTVAHQHVIGDPDGNLLAIDGISDVAAGKDARLLLLRTHALDLAHMPRLVNIGVNFGTVLGRGDLLDPGMFGGQHEERHAIDGVRARGEDGNLFPLAIDLCEETNLCALAAPNPVALHGYGLFGPLDFGEVQQFFGIIGNSEQPLVDLFANDGGAAAFAGAVRQYLLVCQRGVTAWTPVCRGFGTIGQPVLIELQEQPLRPFIVVRQAG